MRIDNGRVVTFCTVTYKTSAQEIVQCLESISRAAVHAQLNLDGGLSVRVIVVNNGCLEFDPDSIFKTPRIKKLTGIHKFELINNPRNVGYGAAQNIGFANAEGHVHILLNPDVTLQEDTLTEGLVYFDKHPDVVGITPFAVDRKGKRQWLCKRYPSVFDLFVRGFCPDFLKKLAQKRLYHYEYRDLCRDQHIFEPELISGCFMFCRRSALSEVCCFDAGYFMYFEDFDLSIRLKKVGKLVYLSSLKIEHNGGDAAKKGLRHVIMFLKSSVRFFNKHGWKLH